MKRLPLPFSALASVALLLVNICPAQELDVEDATSTPHVASQRHFLFHYGGSISNIPAGAHVRVWLPVAHDTPQQKLASVKWQLPVEAAMTTESTYGNKMLYFEFQAVEQTDLPFSVDYDIRRSEVNSLLTKNIEQTSDAQRARFLSADRLVPVDGRPLEMIKGFKLPTEQLEIGRRLYDRVDEFMSYDKSKPGYGNGDSVWACDNGTGNCTDFHSVFISLMRSQNIPARFEIGFPIPPESGAGTIDGYHCWASFLVDNKGWIPVDISEADKHPELKEYYFGNLTPNRISFTVGRDIDLMPKQDGPPLNYFVYPYVEVDGVVWPNEKIEFAFRYEDVVESQTSSRD